MNDIFELLRSSKDPSTMIYECLLNSDNHFSNSAGKIIFEFSKNRLHKKALLALKKLDILDSPSYRHTFVFCMAKSLLEMVDADPSASTASLKCARSILLKNDPTHIKLWLEIYEFAQKDNNLKLPFFIKIINKLNLKNNFEYFLWNQICGSLAGHGILKLNLNRPDIAYRYKHDKSSFNNLLFNNHVAKGNISGANNYLSKLDPKQFDTSILLNIDFLEILKGNSAEGQLHNIPHASPVQIKYNEYYKELLKKNAMGALLIAKEIVEIGHIDLKWTKLILADAEICNLNLEAANYLIKQAQNDMSCSDHLMLARIEYQKGNLSKCAELFQYSLNECKRLDMYQYFLFRLRCSLELKPVDILKIMNEINSKQLDTKLNKINLKNKDKIKFGIQRYIGNSNSSIKVKEEIKQFANIDMPILITGETGVGKEVVAQAIHEESHHSKEPFLPINCGAIVGTLLQSELFGHTEGAFTSANKNHVGIFEAAGKGTVFLDEFGEISTETQVALLRVLETRTIRPIGSSQTKKIKCHITVATNAKLPELVKSGKFRSDLYYRLKSLEIHLAPLRKRKDDIITLAIHFLNSGRNNEHLSNIDTDGKKLLSNHLWPGNTRELKNEMQKVRILNSNKTNYSADDFIFLNDLYDDSQKNNLQIKQKDPLNNKPEAQKIQLFINNKSTHRRIKNIKELFQEHKTLRRIELINTLNISQATATKDLKKLTIEGFIKKIKPTNSSRTHYFELA